jgi:hypothetical protein
MLPIPGTVDQPGSRRVLEIWRGIDERKTVAFRRVLDRGHGEPMVVFQRLYPVT